MRTAQPITPRLNYNSITIGSVYSFRRKITKKDSLAFANLSGDFNPLHTNEMFGQKSQFKKNIVHGMLGGIFFSTLIGMYCPGEKSLYLSQTLNFRLPLYYGDNIVVKGTVIDKNDSINLITLRTEIIKDNKIAINGEAKVRVINND